MQNRRLFLKSTAALGLAASVPGAASARAPAVGTQAPGYYRMKLGGWEVTALSDGTLALPMADIYQGLGRDRIDAYLRSRFLDRAEVSVNAYLVNTGDRLVLIDTGAGDVMGPALGRLVSNIRAAGYAPDQVDDVILTHIHADHSGGLTTGQGRRVYENAMLHVNATEADFWLRDPAAAGGDAALRAQIAQAHANIDPYQDADRLRRFADDAAPLPGIGSIMRAGHTAGHSSIVVENAGEKLVIWGDIAHGDALQFDDVQVTVTFDVDQPRAARARALALAEAAEQGYLVAGAHQTFPGIGHVRRDGEGYDWLPLTWRAGY